MAEPVIQKYGIGENQILVELPGVPDTSRIEEIIQSTAKLAIHAVVAGPYANAEEAIQAEGGSIPPDLILLHGSGAMGAPDLVWVLRRASEVEGTDFRDAQPSTDQNGRPDIHFALTTEAGERFSGTPPSMPKGVSPRVQWLLCLTTEFAR